MILFWTDWVKYIIKFMSKIYHQDNFTCFFKIFTTATRKLTRTYTVHVCGLHSVSLGGGCFRLYDSLLFLHVLGNILRHGVEQMAEHS